MPRPSNWNPPYIERKQTTYFSMQHYKVLNRSQAEIESCPNTIATCYLDIVSRIGSFTLYTK